LSQAGRVFTDANKPIMLHRQNRGEVVLAAAGLPGNLKWN